MLLECGEHILQISLLGAYILNLLWPMGLSLDRNGARIPGFSQSAEDLLEIDQSRADEHLFSEFVRVCRPTAILGMNRTHVRPEYRHCIHGIRLAVQDEICSIETAAGVWQ